VRQAGRSGRKVERVGRSVGKVGHGGGSGEDGGRESWDLAIFCPGGKVPSARDWSGVRMQMRFKYVVRVRCDGGLGFEDKHRLLPTASNLKRDT
jgi:hypothetical protein